MKIYRQRLLDYPFLTKWFKSLYVSLGKIASFTDSIEESDYILAGIDSSFEFSWPVFGDDNSSYVNSNIHEDEQPLIWGNDYFVFSEWKHPLNPVIHRCNWVQQELDRYLHNLAIVPDKKYIFFWNHPFINPRKKIFNKYGDNFIIVGTSLSSHKWQTSEDGICFMDESANGYFGPTYEPFRDISMPTMSTVQGELNEKYERKYSFSFMGANSHPLRESLESLNEFDKAKVRVINSGDAVWRGHSDTKSSDYVNLLNDSTFTLVPRGDSPYVYRLMEAMKFGSIPIIISDNWALPFSEILDYRDFSLRVKEDEWQTIPNRIKTLDDWQIKRLQDNVRTVYSKHFSSFDNQIQTLLRILELRK